VALTISPEHLAFTNINKEYAVEAGNFEIMVGNSSRDQDLTKILLHVISPGDQSSGAKIKATLRA
jgi:beta-glucosidase